MTSQGDLGPHIVTETPAGVLTNGGPSTDTMINGSNTDEIDVPDITELKIEFEASSDQYGRVTVYSIEVLGWEEWRSFTGDWFELGWDLTSIVIVWGNLDGVAGDKLQDNSIIW